MRVFLAILLIGDSCYAADLIHTSIGVIDPNVYVNKKQDIIKPGVYSRKKRSSVYSSSEKQAILDKHNELRSGVSPEASDMNFMTWDDDLATLAQEWSDTCTWDHGTPDSDTTTEFDPYGQNLWLGGGTSDNRPDGIGATGAWYNEVSQYTYDTRECSGVCGHYTQVVWADSYALGCGISFCDVTSEGQTNAWIMTCHYGPAGNYPRHPYLNGPSCTKCSSGSGQCYDNQCRSCDDHSEECDCKQQCKNCGTLFNNNCTCGCQTGFIDGDCSGICEDSHSNCRNGWYPAQCSGYDYVRDGCPLMCSLCSAAPDDFVCEEEEEEEEEDDTTTQMPDQMLTNTISQEQEHTTAGDCDNECQNDGTIDATTCKCACPTGYQGDSCEEVKEQVKNGVELTISASISIWYSIVSSFLEAIDSAIDKFCNIDVNYGMCCPNSGDKTGQAHLNYIDSDEIIIADGFPKSVDSDSFVIMVYAVPETDNELCAAGESSANRKRRDINRYIQVRIKRDITAYLDQDVLYEAIVASTANISTAIGVPISEIGKGVVVDEESVNEDGGISDGAIAAIVIVIIIVFAVAIVVIYFVFKNQNKAAVGPHKDENANSTKQKEDMEPKDVDA